MQSTHRLDTILAGSRLPKWIPVQIQGPDFLSNPAHILNQYLQWHVRNCTNNCQNTKHITDNILSLWKPSIHLKLMPFTSSFDSTRWFTGLCNRFWNFFWHNYITSSQEWFTTEWIINTSVSLLSPGFSWSTTTLSIHPRLEIESFSAAASAVFITARVYIRVDTSISVTLTIYAYKQVSQCQQMWWSTNCNLLLYKWPGWTQHVWHRCLLWNLDSTIWGCYPETSGQ